MSLNSDWSTDTLDKIIDGSFFRDYCPYCNFSAQLNYQLLFNDMVHNAMIWVVPPETPNLASKITEIRSSCIPTKDTITRIVSNMDELREKISLLHEKLDDRVVEICKVYLRTLLSDRHPQMECVNAHFVLTENGKYITFKDARGESMHSPFDAELYNAFFKLYMDHGEMSYVPQYPIYDYSWAKKYFNWVFEKEEASDGNNASSEENYNKNEKSAAPLKEVEPEQPTNTSTSSPVPTCKSCGRPLEKGWKLCPFCGAKIILTCKSCGSEIKETWHFCPYCAKKIY
ncbi:MAG: zinc-ribbon domain-containing protein [Bacteroidales bacterium]|nr:zinc-ribbon domain-containing protein [Bacteroidales bacterium]